MKNERRLNFQETVKKEILIELSIHASSFCVKCTTIKFHSFFLVRRFIQTISFLSIAKAPPKRLFKRSVKKVAKNEINQSFKILWILSFLNVKCKKSLDLKENTFVSSKFKNKYLIISLELFYEERLDIIEINHLRK